LGKSYALELAKRGCNVVVNDLGGSVAGQVTVSASSTGSKTSESDGVHAVVAEIKAMGGSAIADTNNVLDAKDIVANAIKHFGSVDVIVNNAGILRDRSFHKMTEEDFQKVIDVHLLGTFRMCHEAWPLMQAQKYGRIVNVSSGAATYGNFGQANYAAAKLGILGMSNVLAKEGAKSNIFVNTIVPVAASRMTENLLSEELLAQMDPKHVTPIVTYLAHESNTNNGQVYEIGGGWYSAMRWQRSEGVVLGGRPEGSTEDRVASVEDIAANMGAISDFSRGQVAYPTSPTDAISTFTSMLDRGVFGTGDQATTPVASSAAAVEAGGSGGQEMEPIDALHSTGLFTTLNNAVIKDTVV
jgi:NAD(P)-dependent dehydrogenase (short-subunit alcohol dehydrogenase family)